MLNYIQQCALPGITIMALWRLLHLGTGCAVTHCGDGLHCAVTRVLKLQAVSDT